MSRGGSISSQGWSVLGRPIPERRPKAMRHGRRLIDDFRLWGSSRCRRMGEYSTETRLFTWMAHTLDSHNDSLSEGGALAVVVRDFPETSHWTRDNTDFPRLMQQSEARLCLARPFSPGAAARRTRGAGSGGSDPRFFGAGAAPGRGRWCTPKSTTSPPLVGVALTTEILRDFIVECHTSFTIKELRIARRCSTPHSIHRDEADFPRPYRPSTDVRRLRNASRLRRTG